MRSSLPFFFLVLLGVHINAYILLLLVKASACSMPYNNNLRVFFFFFFLLVQVGWNNPSIQ